MHKTVQQHLHKALPTLPNIFSKCSKQRVTKHSALNKINKQEKQGCVLTKKSIPHPRPWLLCTFPELPEFTSTYPFAAVTSAKSEQENDRKHKHVSSIHPTQPFCTLHPTNIFTQRDNYQIQI